MTISPLAQPFPAMPQIAGVTPRIARAGYKDWGRCDLTYVELAAGTAVGHLVEWAPEAALAVPVGDAAGLASALQRLLRDEELRLGTARNALHRATAEDADCTVVRFRDLYDELRH